MFFSVLRDWAAILKIAANNFVEVLTQNLLFQSNSPLVGC